MLMEIIRKEGTGDSGEEEVIVQTMCLSRQEGVAYSGRAEGLAFKQEPK